MILTISDLYVKADNRNIIKGIDLMIKTGEVHVLMGPNGSGKSTLSLSLMGHPYYQVIKGLVKIDKINLLDLSPDKRAKAGLFLTFQKPIAIPGVSIINYLRTAYNDIYQNKNKFSSVKDFLSLVKQKANLLKIKDDFLKRSVNDGLSGGESKKLEMLTLSILSPKFAILDEIDTGLDVDALKIIAEGINLLKRNMGFLLITHYQRILKYVKPDFVHILINGTIVKSGNYQLAQEIEENGYHSYEISNLPYRVSKSQNSLRIR